MEFLGDLKLLATTGEPGASTEDPVVWLVKGLPQDDTEKRFTTPLSPVRLGIRAGIREAAFVGPSVADCDNFGTLALSEEEDRISRF